MVGVSATGASQSRTAHRKAQVPGGYPVLAVGVIVSIKSKIVCAVPSGSDPRNLTLCVRRRATEKGKGCVLSSAKIILLFRVTTILHEKLLSFFDPTQGETKTRGLFFDLPLVSLIALPLSLVSLLLWGGKSVAAFSLHSAFVPFPAPSGQCALAHDALARGDAHPRLAHSASFHFFPSPITCNLLNYCSLGVKAFAFP